jgi:hypothetical protein
MNHLKKFKLFEKSFSKFEKEILELFSEIKFDLDTILVELSDIDINYNIEEYIDHGGAELTVQIGDIFNQTENKLIKWSEIKYEVFRSIIIVEQKGLFFNFLRFSNPLINNEEEDIFDIEDIREINDDSKLNIVQIIFYKTND